MMFDGHTRVKNLLLFMDVSFSVFFFKEIFLA